MLGTPFYMSPEQIKDSADLDHRADLWSLAAIACECLTGRRPFQGKDFVEIALLLRGAAQRPVPSRLGPVPAGFDAWFARATHRDIAQRFQTARELLKALAPICGAHGTLLSPGDLPEEVGREASTRAPSGTVLLSAVPRPVPAAAKRALLLAAIVGAATGLYSVVAARQGAPAARTESAIETLQAPSPEPAQPFQPPEMAPGPTALPEPLAAPGEASALAAPAPGPLRTPVPPPPAPNAMHAPTPPMATAARRTVRSKSTRARREGSATVPAGAAPPPEKQEADFIWINGRRMRTTLD